MFSIRCFALLLFCSIVFPPVSQAQIDEVEIALPIQLVEGRLSVTFADTVSEARALNKLTALGYEVVKHDFSLVQVAGLVDGPVTEVQLAAMKKHEKVVDVQLVEEQGMVLHFTLLPTLTSNEANTLVKSLYPDIAIQQTIKRPNEVIIAVDQDADEEAIAQIEALPEVRYVAYINAN